MPLFVQALDLADDPALIERYLDHHRRVWPEVLRALDRLGLRDLRIFHAGTRLVMILDAPDGFDPARDFQSYASDPRAREWDHLMRTFQRQVPGTPATSWWRPLDEVFSLRAALGR